LCKKKYPKKKNLGRSRYAQHPSYLLAYKLITRCDTPKRSNIQLYLDRSNSRKFFHSQFLILVKLKFAFYNWLPSQSITGVNTRLLKPKIGFPELYFLDQENQWKNIFYIWILIQHLQSQFKNSVQKKYRK